MAITEIKAEYVFATMQKLAPEEWLYCVDFERGEMRDSAGLTVEYLRRLVNSKNCKFFKVGGGTDV